jgi:hypothetical protein
MSKLDVGWAAGLVGQLRVRPGSKARLPRDFDPGARFGIRKENDGVRLGIRLVKLFLNVSREKQRARFLQRIDQPEKNWKFSPADVRERQHWAED